jgi:hypothetical protein
VCGKSFKPPSFTNNLKLTKYSSPMLVTHPLSITYLFTMALDVYNAAVKGYNTPTLGSVLPKPNTTNLTVHNQDHFPIK